MVGDEKKRKIYKNLHQKCQINQDGVGLKCNLGLDRPARLTERVLYVYNWIRIAIPGEEINQKVKGIFLIFSAVLHRFGVVISYIAD
jgi:hypothetical protein